MGILSAPLPDLLASLVDRAAVLSAVAAHATAMASPDAKLPELRERMRALRGKLMPAGLSGGFSMTPRLPTVPVVLAVRGGAPWAEVSPRWFRKEIVREGRWIHPMWGEEIPFDRLALEMIAQQTNLLLGSINRIPFPDGHRFDAASNLGWWHGVWTEPVPEGGAIRLMGLVEVLRDETAQRLGRETRDVSMFLEPETRDAHGAVFRNAITHVAATDYPVIDEQTTFAPLELARGTEKITVQVLKPVAAAPATHKENESMALSDKALAALGFARDAKPTETDIEAKVLETTRANLALATEKASLETKVAAFAKAEADTAAAELEQLVKGAKESAAAAKRPEAFGPDEEARVKRLWGAGLKDDARAFAALVGGQRALALGAKPAVSFSGAPDPKKDRETKRIDARLALARNAGQRIEERDGGKTVVIHPARAAAAAGAKAEEFTYPQ